MNTNDRADALRRAAEHGRELEELPTGGSPFRPGVRVRIRGGTMGGKPITGTVVSHPEPSCFSDTVRVRSDADFGGHARGYYTAALEVLDD